jgi:signal peptidase I
MADVEPGRATQLGFWTAAVIGGIGVLTIWMSPVVGAGQAVLFFSIAWGIRRAQPWAAMAGSGVLIGQAITAGLHLVSTEARGPGQTTAFLIFAVLVLACAYLLLHAAFELWRRRERRTMAWPWVAVTAVMVACWALLRPMVMSTVSMADTLLAGDHYVVETASAWVGRSPQRGDIVVFHYPVDRRQVFVKRVVGVSGDRLRIIAKRLYRDGSPVVEPYAVHKTEYVDSYRDNFPGVPNVRLYEPAQVMLDKDVVKGELVVPEGKYFVMGDNRDSALDSRYWGFLTKADIVGRPVLIFASYSDKTLSVLNTRWNRLLRRP